MIASGYQAFREGAALLTLSGRGHIVVTGEDRARLLHAMSTNHVEQLQPGQSTYTFFLNAQGRILADAYVICTQGALLLDSEPETRQFLYNHLDHYIIADDAVLEDRTEQTAVFGLEGPDADNILARSGLNDVLAAGISASGVPGLRLFAPAEAGKRVQSQLLASGAIAVSAAELDIVRLEHGKPRYGIDITADQIPQETQQMHAIHFTKGCYLGQEIVERVRSRGKVKWKLVSLTAATTDPVPPQTKLLLDGKEVGEITSSAYSPAQGYVVALGYVRTEHIRPDARFAAGGIAISLGSPHQSFA